ncbi:3-deoxy-7-phosphoheptulonate synthase [Bacteroides heparinolyticus]|uniref:3-deoxy-7-phosphoheptulonate synthase n=1 Tax=Prevotella heparinolytica TaxID=28113 RepID=UPI0035A06F50
MGINYLQELPTPMEIKRLFPLSKELAQAKEAFDKEVADIFTGKSDKFLVLIGPCSADSEDSVLEYVHRLAKVQENIKDKMLLIPRIYTGKPRTNGDGYKGLLHQPDPERGPNMHEGIIAIRKMHLRVIQETGFFTADEMLYVDNLTYLDDLLSYIAVGARSVENQEHRLTSSVCDVPVGMKNPTSGDFSVMLNAVYTAQQQHQFIHRGMEVISDGNPLSHAILRGAVDQYGTNIPNYHYEDMHRVIEMYKERALANPAIIVDANHANSNKQYKQQTRIVKEVLHSRNHSEDIHKFLKGVMIESYLVEGTRKIDEYCYGKSITDPCLGWEDSEKLLYDIYRLL